MRAPSRWKWLGNQGANRSKRRKLDVAGLPLQLHSSSRNCECELTGKNSEKVAADDYFASACCNCRRIAKAIPCKPRIRIIPSASTNPNRCTKFVSSASTSAGSAPVKASTNTPTKPLTVGASGATSAWMSTLPSTRSTQRNTGVWHSCTRCSPASRSAWYLAGSFGRPSANSRSNSRRSRGSSSANSAATSSIFSATDFDMFARLYPEPLAIGTPTVFPHSVHEPS